MSHTFTNRGFEWTKTGEDPTASEISLGLQGGMALPAEFVNQQWTKTYLAIIELITLLESGEIEIGTSHTVSGTGYAVFGTANTANDNNTVIGKRSKTPTAAALNANTGDLFVIGNGIVGGTKANALRVTAAGEVMGTQAYTASGADFAEMFEWLDGNPDNEDRRGLFVTLDGEKIRLATSEDDYIAGVVSATPTVIGDSHTDDWQGKYEKDVFGCRILVDGAWRLSEGFDESMDDNYTSRLERSEWASVGLTGKLIVVDDGSCQVNGYCYPSDKGIASASEKGFRVMARIDSTHIKILLK